MRHKFTLFRRKGAKIWYFHYYQDGIRQARSTGRRLKHEAEREAASFVEELEGEAPRRIRFAEFAEGFFDQAGEWVRSQHDSDYSFAPKQSIIRNGHLRNYAIPRFGDHWMDEIEAYEIRRWLQELKLANNTKNAIISTMNILYNEARFQKYVERNPMDDVKRFSRKYQQRDAFSLEDIRFLFPRSRDALLAIWKEPRFATLFYAMLTTGIRRSEAAALQWKHVVWEKRGILVLQAVKAEKVIGLPKSGDQRAVLLPARTLALLRWWHDQTLFSEPEHFVFHGSWGNRYIYPDNITRVFNKALDRANFDRKGRILTVHSLRHTYNTRLEKVLPGEILRYMVGHRTPAMTEQYLHVTPEERLEEYLSVRKQIGQAWN